MSKKTNKENFVTLLQVVGIIDNTIIGIDGEYEKLFNNTEQITENIKSKLIQIKMELMLKYLSINYYFANRQENTILELCCDKKSSCAVMGLNSWGIANR